MEQVRDLIGKLIEYNSKKEELLERFLQISKEQKLSIESNSLNSLMDNIKKKQGVMEEIDTIDRHFYGTFVELKQLGQIESIEEIDTKNYPEVLRLKSTVSTIMSILEDIDKLDKENVSKVTNEIEKVKNSMKEVQGQRKISKGYSSIRATYGTDPQGFYIDSKK